MKSALLLFSALTTSQYPRYKTDPFPKWHQIQNTTWFSFAWHVAAVSSVQQKAADIERLCKLLRNGLCTHVAPHPIGNRLCNRLHNRSISAAFCWTEDTAATCHANENQVVFWIWCHFGNGSVLYRGYCDVVNAENSNNADFILSTHWTQQSHRCE
jgi:hypothetical protein